MAKKFFYNKVHNTKRSIINLIIIGVCIIGVIICFIITSNIDVENKDRDKGNLSIKSDTTIEVNETFTNEIFFSSIEGFDVNTIEVKYPSNYDVSTPGKYEVKLVIDKKEYTTTLNVVDTIKPELKLKPVTIEPNTNYSPNDFVSDCFDNSNKECQITFDDTGIDEDGNSIDYSIYKDEGIYPIKITATDPSNNKTTLETELTIKKSEEPLPSVEPKVCKYGDNSYNQDEYLLTVDVTTGGCAISLDLYKDEQTMKKFNQIMETETVRIVKDLQKFNLQNIPSIDRRISVILNTSGTGVVGYELRMMVNVKIDDVDTVIVDYKLDNLGKRVFTVNTYNLLP